jgi:DNA-directed RNA polymerase subunit RPC12/RpoP
MTHLVNCTYCHYRWVMKPKVKKAGAHEEEFCRLTNKQIPHPRVPGRWCERFQAPGCDCEKCNNVTIENQLEHTIDNGRRGSVICI